MTTKVSIHAPLRREERPVAYVTVIMSDKFQSTPPSGERSDATLIGRIPVEVKFQSTPPSGERSDLNTAWSMIRRYRFNPRPPPERGATMCHPSIPDGLLGFNPRPPPERGATLRSRRARFPVRVSIHAPLRREERQSIH